jgi:hypothetical protein
MPSPERLRGRSTAKSRAWFSSLPDREASLRYEGEGQCRHRRQAKPSVQSDVVRSQMQIALVLYPKFTVLDIIGPFQALVEARTPMQLGRKPLPHATVPEFRGR